MADPVVPFPEITTKLQEDAAKAADIVEHAAAILRADVAEERRLMAELRALNDRLEVHVGELQATTDQLAAEMAAATAAPKP